MSIPVSGSILFHCWRHEDMGAARFTLESICKNGLLLTTNSRALDIFEIHREKGVEQMEVMQRPRVCFTDIPIDLLASHGQRYGRYGVGFRRETVIDWGGLPAWYLPNYWGETLKVVGPVLVNGLHAAMDAAGQFEALAKELIAKDVPLSVMYQHGPTVQADQLVTEMQHVRNSIFMVLSFIKEMSPRSIEDHSYLFEREWRIVGGFALAGRPPCRALTQDEKNSLCSRKPMWGEKRESKDINISSRYGGAPVIDSFLYFNGMSGRQTIAQLIDTILVPDEAEARWVKTFLVEHADYFGTVKPNIIIFPGEEGSKSGWRGIIRHSRVTTRLLVALIALGLGGIVIYDLADDNSRTETGYADLRLGMTMDEVKYVKGYPTYILEYPKITVEKPTWWENSASVIASSSLKDGQNVEDFRSWEFAIDDHGTRIDVDFDQRTKLLSKVACYSQRIMQCPSLLGLHDGMSEADAIKRLGKPSYERIDGVTKKVSYDRLGVWFYLEKMKIYMLGVESPPSLANAPPCKDGSQVCEPWERDWNNTNLQPGTTVTRDGVVGEPKPLLGKPP
jgi:Putative abortive phage resistance protein AbiGi, antitoxin